MKIHILIVLFFVGVIAVLGGTHFLLNGSTDDESEVEGVGVVEKEDDDMEDVYEVAIIQDVPRDAIPPLDSPKYETIEEVSEWLEDDDIVLGVVFDNDARAYPSKLMNWHEIVNETIGDREVSVTYCQLCNSGVVFDRHLNGRLLNFGNTGALYESAMVMYDRETETYWYHINGLGLQGPLKGERLSILPSSMMLWRDWKEQQPNTQVLSLDTGFSRPYLSNPSVSYAQPNSDPAFPVSRQDARLFPKEQVIGVTVQGISKAYLIKAVQGKSIRDTVHGKQVEVVGDDEGISAQLFFIEDNKRVPAPSSSTFWFAWFAAYPDTELYK